MSASLDSESPLRRYTIACERSTAQVISAYSTSFGTATRLLGARHRTHVRNIYGLVRIADELVDGVTREAGLDLAAQHRALDRLEADTAAAIADGYSSNPIVHAFAHTARAAQIESALITPFFASMRADIALPEHATTSFDEATHERYVYGSAEVVGLMCLRVFVRDDVQSKEQLETLEHGARQLGAAFQNVNFLRDLADDTGRLGRNYLSERGVLTTAQRDAWVTTIRAQLSDAAETLPLLPRDARVAVGAALRLFGRLTDRIAATPTHELYERRIRVPATAKAWLVAQSVCEYRGERIA